jgi:hypothetical protein
MEPSTPTAANLPRMVSIELDWNFYFLMHVWMDELPIYRAGALILAIVTSMAAMVEHHRFA